MYLFAFQEMQSEDPKRVLSHQAVWRLQFLSWGQEDITFVPCNQSNISTWNIIPVLIKANNS